MMVEAKRALLPVRDTGRQMRNFIDGGVFLEQAPRSKSVVEYKEPGHGDADPQSRSKRRREPADRFHCLGLIAPHGRTRCHGYGSGTLGALLSPLVLGPNWRL